MAHSTLEIASTLSHTINFNKTNAEVGQILEWFIADWADTMPGGLTQAQQNQWKLEQAHQKMIDFVVREAYRNRTRQLREEFQDSLEEQVQQETEL